MSSDATILVVDDDDAVRRGVARLVRSAGFAALTFASPAEFLGHPLPAGPACVVLDVCMEGMSGLDVQVALNRDGRRRRVPVVFLSGHGTVATAAACFRSGAQDFLEKPFRPAELLDAVRRAVELDRAQNLDRGEREQLRQRFERLTLREQEVMRLVVSGLLNKQAAAELGISEKTVKVHRSRVMEKMEVESLAQLVLVAERVGVLDAADALGDVEATMALAVGAA